MSPPVRLLHAASPKPTHEWSRSPRTAVTPGLRVLYGGNGGGRPESGRLFKSRSMWLMVSRWVSCTTCVYTSMVMLTASVRGSPSRRGARLRPPLGGSPDDAEAGGLGDAGEGAVDVPRLDLATGTGGEDVPRLVPLLPRLDARGRLPHPVPAQRGDAERGQRYDATTAALGVVVVRDAATTLGLLADVEDTIVEVEVEVGPAETDDLSPAQARGDGEDEGRVERVSAGRGEEVQRLVQAPGLQLPVVRGAARPAWRSCARSAPHDRRMTARNAELGATPWLLLRWPPSPSGRGSGVRRRRRGIRAAWSRAAAPGRAGRATRTCRTC